jgi:hypothetical protein
MNWTGIGYSRDFGFYREYGFTNTLEALRFSVKYSGRIDPETKTVRI